LNPGHNPISKLLSYDTKQQCDSFTMEKQIRAEVKKWVEKMKPDDNSVHKEMIMELCSSLTENLSEIKN
jgi:hypothetical protein